MTYMYAYLEYKKRYGIVLAMWDVLDLIPEIVKKWALLSLVTLIINQEWVFIES